MNVDLKYETPESQESHPELIKQTEEFFYFSQNNLTQDAKNSVWKFLNLVKRVYPTSQHQREWDNLMKNLMQIMDGFHHDVSTKSELKLAAAGREAEVLAEKEEPYEQAA